MPIVNLEESMWKDILKIESEAYTEIESESLDALKSRWKVSPELCSVYIEDGVIAAYLLAHCWGSDEPPKLFLPLAEDTHGDILFIHDLAVSSQYTGLGIGRKMAGHVLAAAVQQGFGKAMLVSIQNSQNFWSGLGFREMAGKEIDPCYGPGAVAMQQDLSPQQ